MPAVNVKVQPEIISWALSRSKEEKLGNKLMKNIEQWLAGTKSPTFNQIEEFSRRSCIPLGYFFLQTPPEENIDLLEYRTVDSVRSAEPSRDLIDTVHEMESIQQWMSDYRRDLGYEPNVYAGCIKGDTETNTIAEKIRKDLGLKKEWHKECGSIQDAFYKLRELLGECGIIVMMSGVVAKNSHRALDPEEFRAFAMVNDFAPLIFINGADSWGGRLFSLYHETVHIWLGRNDFYNDRTESDRVVNTVEIICNAVAGELMVPDSAFLKRWGESQTENSKIRIKELAKNLLCSESVIARKAFNHKKISKKMYDEIVKESIEAYTKWKQEKTSGGNYYSTLQSRLDGVFVRALCESINSGRTSYTEAYRLTNTTGKTFSEVAGRLGGVLW